MISPPKNRVQEIKSRFENLNCENPPVTKKTDRVHLNKHIDECIKSSVEKENHYCNHELSYNKDKFANKSASSDIQSPKPNASYLHRKNDLKISVSDSKTSLSRQTSDPGKKLHRSHAFRCDKSQKIGQSPKRHDSCNGRSETSGFTVKMEKKLNEEHLKVLGNFIQEQMRKDQFTPKCVTANIVGMVKDVQTGSIPDSEVPKYILDQYAVVTKPKRKEAEKNEAMTDSGVSSETENTDEEKNGRLKRLLSQFEKAPDKSNLNSMDQLCDSSETIRLERKNPHLKLTDTLKKALKQPLPPGPPPQKPPRTFVTIPENIEIQKIETKRKLEKLEKVLQKRNEVEVKSPNPETATKKPKEMHYLCTEILDITNRTLSPNQSNDPLTPCLNSLNCAITNNSMSSLPYTRMRSEANGNRNSIRMCCSCSNDSLHVQRMNDRCVRCQNNDDKNDRFKCHLSCRCSVRNSEFYVKDHIYDVPFTDNEDSEHLLRDKCSGRRNKYGTLNKLKNCKSMEELRPANAETNIYDIAYEPLEPRFLTPEPSPSYIDLENPFEVDSPRRTDLENITEADSSHKSNLENVPEDESPTQTVFDKLRSNFEVGSSAKTDFDKIEVDSPPRTDFEKLRSNFEKTEEARKCLKPILVSKIRQGMSSESLNEEFKTARQNVEKKFKTEVKKYKKDSGHITFTLPKRDTQLDLDKENLNCLMNEIYETVTAVCNMDDNKPGSFPTEQSDGSTSEESVKLTRSLTEKRKNYVRRVSTRVAYLDPKNIKTTRFRHQTSVCSYKSEIIDNPYSTFRSWKSFRTSQSNISKMERDSTDSKFNLTDSCGNGLTMRDVFSASKDTIDNISIDEKAGCLDIRLPFEPRERGLFNLCILVGLNYMSGEAYVKSVFPSQVQVPPHIENLVFPETMSDAPKTEWSVDAHSQQCYSLVLTDERGERSYGYCRRVLPEGATTCLPLLYCLIGRYRAPGFYYKILEEIESHHGVSDIEIQSILQQLFETDFPNPGEDITIQYTWEHKDIHTYEVCEDRSQTLPDLRRHDGTAKMLDASSEGDLSDCYDTDNNNVKRIGVNFGVPRTKIIRRPIEPRADEDNLSVLLDSLGAGLVIKVFGSLLLERKVIVVGDKLRAVSSCVEALQSSLYPFVWQHTLISSIPAELRRDLLDAPLPILAGMLHAGDQLSPVNFEEGMLIDLTHPSKVLSCHGDESTILPTPSFKTLKTSLKMETSRIRDKAEDTKTRNVMISEAFMRFFVDILGDFWRFFRVGKVTADGMDMGRGDVVFDKDAFIKSSNSKENQYFLEWFTETAMFNHFIQNMAETHRHRSAKSTESLKLVDTPLPDFYELFHERFRSRNNLSNKNVDSSKNNYKNAVNKKVKFLKGKLRELVA